MLSNATDLELVGPSNYSVANMTRYFPYSMNTDWDVVSTVYDQNMLDLSTIQLNMGYHVINLKGTQAADEMNRVLSELFVGNSQIMYSGRTYTDFEFGKLHVSYYSLEAVLDS